VASKKLAFFIVTFVTAAALPAVARGGAGGAGGGAGGAASDTGGGSSADAGSHQQCWYRWHLQLGFSDWRNFDTRGCKRTEIPARAPLLTCSDRVAWLWFLPP
jgi:hypothetical protein